MRLCIDSGSGCSYEQHSGGKRRHCMCTFTLSGHPTVLSVFRHQAASTRVQQCRVGEVHNYIIPVFSFSTSNYKPDMNVVVALLILVLVVRYLNYKENGVGHLDIIDFNVESTVPQCLTLSSTHDTFVLVGHSLDNIHTIQTEYAVALKNATLISDYTNDYFTDKRDPTHLFCVTRRVHASNYKSCVYVPGNNDYFNNTKLGTQFYDQGYNFYAIAFPNFGFASTSTTANYSTFASIPGLYKYIDFLVEFYRLPQIDVLIGHSTGGLISICYAEYRNQNQPMVKRLVLSSPLLDWYGDPRATSYFRSADFLKHVITPIGLFVRKLNLKWSVGTPNSTTCEEFNQVNFNPRYKSLIEIRTYPEWIRACTLMMRRIQSGSVNVKCPVDVLVSDKSTYWEYTTERDNTLDVRSIVKYAHQIGSDVTVHVIPKAVHATLLHVHDICVLLNI